MDVHGLPNPGTMLEKLKDIFRKKLNVHDHLQLHQYTIHSSLVMKVHRIAFLFFQFLSQHPITEPLQSKIGKNHVDSNFRHCICFKIILSYSHSTCSWKLVGTYNKLQFATMHKIYIYTNNVCDQKLHFTTFEILQGWGSNELYM